MSPIDRDRDVQPTLPPGRSGIRKLPSGRARLAIGVLLSLFLVDLGRDVYLQILRQSELRQQGRLRYLRQIVERAPRGEILAANGYPLAITTSYARRLRPLEQSFGVCIFPVST